MYTPDKKKKVIQSNRKDVILLCVTQTRSLVILYKRAIKQLFHLTMKAIVIKFTKVEEIMATKYSLIE